MSTNNSAATVSASSLSEVKALFITAAGGYLAAKCCLVKATVAALKAGATPDMLKAWAKEAGFTSAGINAALRKAGVSQRGVRADKGIARLIYSLDAAVDEKIRAPKADKEEGDTTEAGETPEGDDEGKASESTADKAGKLIQFVLNIAGGDKAKALELLHSAGDTLAKAAVVAPAAK